MPDIHTSDTNAPTRALCWLKEGNARFAEGRRLHRDLRAQIDRTADGQAPRVAILGCIDSRTPAELIFDTGLGDLMNVRVAGNALGDEALGSLEFACKVVGADLLVVLGHTRCGAVSATCDLMADATGHRDEPGLDHIDSITRPISEAVRQETATTDDRTSANVDFVDRVAAINVRNVIEAIRRRSSTLRDLDDAGRIAIVGAMYDVTTGVVEFLAES